MTALAGYDETTFTHDGKTRTVFRRGAGPAVLVISEVPGISPSVVAFADRVADAGFTAVMPSLFGTPGKEPTPGYIAQTMSWACVSKEFTTWATNKTSPATEWAK